MHFLMYILEVIASLFDGSTNKLETIFFEIAAQTSTRRSNLAFDFNLTLSETF